MLLKEEISNIIVLRSAGKAEGKKLLVSSEFSGAGSQEPWQCLTDKSYPQQQEQLMGSELWDPAVPASTALAEISAPHGLGNKVSQLLLGSGSWMTLCFSLSMISYSCDSPGAWAIWGQGWSWGPSDGPREALPQNTVARSSWKGGNTKCHCTTSPLNLSLHSSLNSVALIWVVSSGLGQLTFPLALSLQSLFEVNYCRIPAIKIFKIHLRWSCNSCNSLH